MKNHLGEKRIKMSPRGRLYFLKRYELYSSMSAAMEIFDGTKWADLDISGDAYSPKYLVDRKTLIKHGFTSEQIAACNAMAETFAK